MNQPPTKTPGREPRMGHWLVLAGAACVALFGAKAFAAGWNDGSRLATAEALVDYHTWSIDQSVFVRPSAVAPGAPAPYFPMDAGIAQHGTYDKLLIHGRFYSDKSPVLSLWAAAVYAVLQFCTGWTFRARADAVCHVLTLATAGLAYVLAVWSVYRLGRPLRLPSPWRMLLTAGFALGTVALPYAQNVNNHIVLLAVLAALMVEMAWVAQGSVGWGRMVCLGLLAGLSYTIDLGPGPLLLGGTAVWLAVRCRRPRALALFALAAAPWVVLHHGLNYAIGGVFGPANAVPAYLDWPGSPFAGGKMTGVWGHPSVQHFLLYLLDLLVGQKGFFAYNLVLWLTVPACWFLWRRRTAERPELVLAVVWCVGVWLLYGAGSTNRSGLCCSVRWFVPLLAPAHYILAVWLRDCPPGQRRDFCVLSAWGLAMGGVMAWVGPFLTNLFDGFGAVRIGLFTGAAASWLLCVYLRWRGWPANARLSLDQADQRRAA